MSRYDSVRAVLDGLPPSRQDEIAEVIAEMFRADFAQASELSDEQLEDLRRRAADSGAFASDDEVEAFFSDASA